MKDVMISIRLPPSFLEELAEAARKDHFLDLSEAIRSIIRQKWIEKQNPELTEIKALRENITQELHEMTAQRVQKEVAQELKRIREQLKRGRDE